MGWGGSESEEGLEPIKNVRSSIPPHTRGTRGARIQEKSNLRGAEGIIGVWEKESDESERPGPIRSV